MADKAAAPVKVRVENLCKDFGKFRAIDQVSFELKQGEVLGFLGPNGAGKTTTMRILTGFFPPSEGKVFVGGIELFQHPREAKKKIGYLPESVNLYPDMRVEEFLYFVARLKGVSRRNMRGHLEEIMERCGLWEMRKRLIGRLSKGYKQRTGLAQALISNPDILVLDEPTNGLDPKQIIEIRKLIREIGRERSLILSTHILPEVSMVCDRVLIMNRGKVVASGTTSELEAGLTKAHEVYVIIGDRTRKDEALNILRSFSSVEHVSVEEKEGHVSFCMTMGQGEDLRPAITRIFVQHQIPLLEIRSGRLSLEEIFMKIVVNEEMPGEPGEAETA